MEEERKEGSRALDVGEEGETETRFGEDVKAEVEGRLISKQLRTAAMQETLLRLAMKGVNAVKAAEVVGCPVGTVRGYYGKPEFKKKVLRRIDRAFEGIDEAYDAKVEGMHERLERAADKSFSVLMEMLEGGVEGVQVGHKIKIAQDFLNRNPETQQGFIHRNEAGIDAETLAIAAKAAAEMNAIAEGKVQRIRAEGDDDVLGLKEVREGLK